MALTLEGLQTQLTTMASAMKVLEKQVARTVAHEQLTRITLLLQSDIEALQEAVATLEGRVSTLETLVNEHIAP